MTIKLLGLQGTHSRGTSTVLYMEQPDIVNCMHLATFDTQI